MTSLMLTLKPFTKKPFPAVVENLPKEYDVSDADIEAFYKETISGNGGDPPKGTITAELIVKFFYGEFSSKGFARYSGFWKGPPPGTIGKKDIKVGYQKMKEFFENPIMQFISKGGIGFG